MKKINPVVIEHEGDKFLNLSIFETLIELKTKHTLHMLGHGEPLTEEETSHGMAMANELLELPRHLSGLDLTLAPMLTLTLLKIWTDQDEESKRSTLAKTLAFSGASPESLPAFEAAFQAILACTQPGAPVKAHVIQSKEEARAILDELKTASESGVPGAPPPELVQALENIMGSLESVDSDLEEVKKEAAEAGRGISQEAADSLLERLTEAANKMADAQAKKKKTTH